MTDTPIACTLSPDGLQARLALIDTLAADGLLDRTAHRYRACGSGSATNPFHRGAHPRALMAAEFGAAVRS